MNSTQLHPQVQAALDRLSLEESTDNLSLEEILMCYHQKPCIRVDESWDTRFKYGSTLVYTDQVILVANEPALHLEPPTHHRVRFISPQRTFGVLAGSRFLTQQTLVYVFKEPNDVRAMREVLRKNAGRPASRSMFQPNAAGSLRRPRCVEEAGLWGRLDAARFMRAMGSVAEGAD